MATKDHTMTILITGATGRTASHLTKRLLESGARVRALVRNPAKAKVVFADVPPDAADRLEIVDGDFGDVQLLQRAFDGVGSVFLALGTSTQQIAFEKALIDAAAHARVGQVVRLSVLGASQQGGYEVARRHGELDDYLAASGVAHTLLRPAYFMSNLLFAAASIASAGRWYGLVPSARIAMIDTRDVADAAHAVLGDPARQNVSYDLTGPASLTFAEVAGRFTALLGRPIQYVPIDEATMRQGYAKRGVPDWLADIALGIEHAMQAGRHAALTPALERLIGRPARSIDDFIRDHQSAFSSSTAPSA
ncbi:hypothetical protein AQ611_11775 [Burkholderia singularis]|nr:hypothetical protein AQ611_11775 [Burkholderia sp. Bp7605]